MFDPVDRDLADRHEAAMLARETSRARRECFMQLGDNGDGTWTGRFRIPELHGQLLARALDRLTTPRRWNRAPHHPDPQQDGQRDGQRDQKPNPWYPGPTGPVTTDDSAPEGTGFKLGADDRRGLALCELLEHLPTDGFNSANGITLLVTMQLADLLTDLREAPGATSWRGPDETGVAHLDGYLDHTAGDATSGSGGSAGSGGGGGGVRITASQARRLACEAGLAPVVLDGDSLPLDLGREKRLHTPAQRRALSLAYATCAITGCDRPFAWCEVHHPDPWDTGGPTDLDNALPLCAWHHGRAHETQWTLGPDPDDPRPRHRTGWRLTRRT